MSLAIHWSPGLSFLFIPFTMSDRKRTDSGANAVGSLFREDAMTRTIRVLSLLLVAMGAASTSFA